MFAYCGNDPVNCSDATGTTGAVCLQATSDWEALPFSKAGGVAIVVLTVVAVGYLASKQNSVAIPRTKNMELVATIPNPEPESLYSVYFLYAADGDKSDIVYVGRVKTINYHSRMAYHATKGRLPAGAIHGLTYEQCRIIEQGGMILLHTLGPGDPLYNQIRGIGPANRKKYDYIVAVWELINRNLYPEFPILPATYWFNFAENEYLNMGL